jgi:hypothetical protein
MFTYIKYYLLFNNIMKTFLDDIASHLLINKKAALFIEHRKIKHYNFKNVNKRSNIKNKNKTVKIKELDLPYNVLLGSSFLIKNNNIIELYAYCNYKQSVYIPITKYKDEWVCNINIINIQEGDPENVLMFVEGINKINNSDVLEYFIVDFLNVGFSLYIKI